MSFYRERPTDSPNEGRLSGDTWGTDLGSGAGDMGRGGGAGGMGRGAAPPKFRGSNDR